MLTYGDMTMASYYDIQQKFAAEAGVSGWKSYIPTVKDQPGTQTRSYIHRRDRSHNVAISSYHQVCICYRCQIIGKESLNHV
jgi:hypothetical protein